jgi:hypothetical protein
MVWQDWWTKIKQTPINKSLRLCIIAATGFEPETLNTQSGL